MKGIKAPLIVLCTLALFTSFYTDTFAASKTKLFSQKNQISILKKNGVSKPSLTASGTCYYQDTTISPMQNGVAIQSAGDIKVNTNATVTCEYTGHDKREFNYDHVELVVFAKYKYKNNKNKNKITSTSKTCTTPTNTYGKKYTFSVKITADTNGVITITCNQ